jgi:hypothetical protein
MEATLAPTEVEVVYITDDQHEVEQVVVNGLLIDYGDTDLRRRDARDLDDLAKLIARALHTQVTEITFRWQDFENWIGERLDEWNHDDIHEFIKVTTGHGKGSLDAAANIP